MACYGGFASKVKMVLERRESGWCKAHTKLTSLARASGHSWSRCEKLERTPLVTLSARLSSGLLCRKLYWSRSSISLATR